MLTQLFWLAVLPLPVACVSWTITREEIFREPREWLQEQSRSHPKWWFRKIAYMPTCEYCFSHYVAAAFVLLVDFRLLLGDWRGGLIAWLSVVAVANLFLSFYSHLRVEIRKDRAESEAAESVLDVTQNTRDK